MRPTTTIPFLLDFIYTDSRRSFDLCVCRVFFVFGAVVSSFFFLRFRFALLAYLIAILYYFLIVVYIFVVSTTWQLLAFDVDMCVYALLLWRLIFCFVYVMYPAHGLHEPALNNLPREKHFRLTTIEPNSIEFISSFRLLLNMRETEREREKTNHAKSAFYRSFISFVNGIQYYELTQAKAKIQKKKKQKLNK